MIKRTLLAIAVISTLVGQAFAQGGPGGGPSGPGPVPDPWTVNGSAISYNGCVLVPANVTGGCKGNGTFNATTIYQGGFQVLGTLANGKIFVGNASAVGIGVTPSGDVTMTNTGLFDVVTYNGGSTFGTAASATVGTSGNTVPKNNTANLFSVAQTVSLNANPLPTALTGTALRVGQADGAISRLEIDSFGTSSPGVLSVVYGRGTGAAPTAVQSGDELGSFNSWGYIGAGTKSTTAVSAIRTYAAENFSAGHQGSKACIATTLIAGSTLTDGLCQQNDFGVTIGAPTAGSQGVGTLNAQGLYVNGIAVASSGSAITALTGDVVATGPGSAASTIQPNVVTYAKFQQVAALSLVGNATGSLANATGISTGTGVITALEVNVGSSGAFVTFNGTLGTPSSGVATNLTGTASGLTAGNVTTNANLTGPITSVGNATSVTSAAITNTMLATMATNTVKGNATSGSASPTDLAVGSCSTAASALIWTTNTGFGCNTSITANAVPAANLTGATLAAGVTGSSLTSVGALGAGSATTGFSIAGASVTWSSQIAGANVAVVANASGSPSATFGVMKADGTTITCSSGTCSAVGGVATSIGVGSTTVTSGTSTQILYNNGGTLGNEAATSIAFGTGTLSLSGNLTTTGAFNPTFAIGASVTYTFPGSAATLASLNITSQNLTGGATVTGNNIGTPTNGSTATINCGTSPIQWLTNNVAGFTIAAPTSDSSCLIQITNGASAGTITFSGFTVGSNTGAALDTVNGHKFFVSIARANGSSIYNVIAQQ